MLETDKTLFDDGTRLAWMVMLAVLVGSVSSCSTTAGLDGVGVVYDSSLVDGMASDSIVVFDANTSEDAFRYTPFKGLTLSTVVDSMMVWHLTVLSCLMCLLPYVERTSLLMQHFQEDLLI